MLSEVHMKVLSKMIFLYAKPLDKIICLTYECQVTTPVTFAIPFHYSVGEVAALVRRTVIYETFIAKSRLMISRKKLKLATQYMQTSTL
jgi:hypothetical protein